jgi:predicted transcriptional regulator
MIIYNRGFTHMAKFGKFINEEIEEFQTPYLDQLFESGKSVAQIAKELDVSQSFVHRTLKDAAAKMFYTMQKAMPDEGPFKVLISVATGLGIQTQEDFNTLKKMLPKEILKKVEDDARNYMGGAGK